MTKITSDNAGEDITPSLEVNLSFVWNGVEVGLAPIDSSSKGPSESNYFSDGLLEIEEANEEQGSKLSFLNECFEQDPLFNFNSIYLSP